MRAVEGEDDKRTTRGGGARAPPERGSQEGSPRPYLGWLVLSKWPRSLLW